MAEQRAGRFDAPVGVAVLPLPTPPAAMLHSSMDDQPMKREFEAAEKQREMLVQVLRAMLIILMAVVGALGLVRASDQGAGILFIDYWWVGAIAILSFFGVVVGIDYLTPKRKLSTITAILFGAFAGIIATLLLSAVIDLLRETYEFLGTTEEERLVLTAKVILGLGLCYLGITTVLQTQDDFRLVIPYVEFAKQFRGTKPMLVDTSALVDGRLADVAQVALFQAPLIVPRIVIDELHALSDSDDKLKRARGRRGLDMLTKMQQNPQITLTVDDFKVPGSNVDQMLVELAQSLPAILVTTDVGLQRVATVHDVPYININDLANSLKPNVIPGERLSLTLIKPGEQPGQGVGYLDDGTMVVAEDGGDAIEQQVTLTVTSAMQTSAGRLIFGRIADGSGPAHSKRSRAEAAGGSKAAQSGSHRSE